MSAGATKSPICKLDPTAIPRLRPILFFIAINTAVECAKIPASQHKGEFKKNFLFNFWRWLFTLLGTSQCNFKIREFVHVRPPLRFDNWADCRSNRKAHRSRQGAGWLSGDDCDRRCWFFCCLLPRNTPGLDFRQSRQLAAGWLYPITDRGRYPAACLPFDTPAIPALNGTSPYYGPLLTVS